MDHFYFKSTKQLQEWIINNAGPDDIVLTSGGRMARQIIHRYRRYKLTSGARCWLPIKAMSLNAWLKSLWTNMWPEYIAASKWNRLSIWLRALKEAPPPGLFHEGISLADNLDENYAILIRHLMSPGKRDLTQQLAQWSLEVTGIFEKNMMDEGFIHPVELPIYINRILSNEMNGKTHLKKIDLPKRIILSCLDQSSPLEKDFFSFLDRIIDVVYLETQAPNISRLEATMLPDSIQEVEWVVERAVEASLKLPLHCIGIAVTDMKTYGNLFERILEDVLGKRAGEGWSSFNITMGKPLIRSPLVQAAILPLRIAMGKQDRAHIFSLLQSPYYGIWAARRHKLAALDRIWRRENLNDNLEHLTNSVKRDYPEEADVLKNLKATLNPILNDKKSKNKVSKWDNFIHEIWIKLGFPVFAGEEDRTAWEHLKEGMGEIKRYLCDEEMSLGRYFQWLSFFSTEKLFSVRGYENEGLQIMGLIEARGLSFDRFFVTGMVSGLLPQPSRSLPFLSPEERRKVQGGTAEDQYRFANTLFQKLIAASPHISLSRPEHKDGEPLVQSPFWPKEEDIATLDLWNTESPLWSSCRWLTQARKGMSDKTAEQYIDPSIEICKTAIPLPSEVSATSLEDGIACPFRFFALHSLQIKPLQETGPGISPLARGSMIHKCLSRFINEVRQKNLDLTKDWQKIRSLLKKEAVSLLSPLSDQFPWRVELKRWINDDENQGTNNMGLLYRWLEEEKRFREKNGLLWLSSEVPFSGLLLTGHKISISGRIDRIDKDMEDGGYICWDYKTGQIPTMRDLDELRASQIFPYIQAVQKSLTHISASAGSAVTGGYIRLDSEGKIRLFEPSFTEEDWKKIMLIWEQRVSELFNKLEEGDIRPSPIPAPTRKDEGACKNCPVRVLCGYELVSGNKG
ncbi:MAG: PD-(D/E)XK nuclease family protein [bacterium]